MEERCSCHGQLLHHNILSSLSDTSASVNCERCRTVANTHPTHSPGIPLSNGLNPCNGNGYNQTFFRQYSKDGSRLEQQQQRKRKRRIRWVFICVSCFLVNIVICITVTVLLSRFFVSSNSSSASSQTKMCVICDAKEQEQGRRLSSESSSTQNYYVCCSSNEVQMKELIVQGVKLSLQDRLKGEDLHQLLNNPVLPRPINKYAAHVFLKPHRGHRPNQPETDDDEYETLREWSSDGNAAFIRQGIEFNSTEGHFKVKDTGIYVMYSRIVYELRDSDPSIGQEVVFGHAISLYAHFDYKDLLEDEQVVTDCRNGYVCYSSRIYSTLYLTKDSHIAVRVRRKTYISTRSHTSYFGLYKID